MGKNAEPRREKIGSGFPTRPGTNWPAQVQLQKMVRSLKFWIYKVEELYHLCSKNKGADQLRSYCEAESGPLFWHRQKSGFLVTRLILLLSLFSCLFNFLQFCAQAYFPRHVIFAYYETDLYKNNLPYIKMNIFTVNYFCEFLFLMKIEKKKSLIT